MSAAQRHPHWRPKFPEVPSQCASCPFRFGNHEEFGAVVNRLRRLDGKDKPATKREVGRARLALLAEFDGCGHGDFICHGTAYDKDMNTRPQAEFRQCAGASRYWQTGQLGDAAKP
jgi:hypothetical protein